MLLKVSRTFLSCVAALVIMLLFLTLRCNAYDFSKVTGASAEGANISGYSGAVQVTVTDFGADPSGTKNSAKAIQQALDYAKDNANSLMQVKVYVPDGKYIINSPLHIYSNTWLYLTEKAEIVRNFDSGCMLYNYHNGNGGYSGNSNIVIEGGTWNGNPSTTSDDFSNLRFGHMQNLWMKNVKVINNKNGHHVELGGIKNVTIEGCEFSGYYGVKEKEAIQLDVMNSSELFAGYEPFDDTSCENVVIRKCSFHDLVRAIGSHSGIMGVYYKNTLITGNTFKNIYGTAIILLNHKNCTIENNEMTDVGNGLDFKYMTPIEYGSFFYPVSGIGNAKFDDFANTIVRNNKITTKISGYSSQPFGLMFYGRNITKSFLPSYNYEVDGLKITGNTIKTVGYGIVCTDVKGAFVKSNKLSFNYDATYSKDCNLLTVTDSNDITITENKLTKCFNNSIYLSASSDCKIEKNSIENPAVSGVYISNGSSDIAVNSNTVSKAGSNGIKAANGSKVSVSSNKVSKSTACGITADNSTITSAKNVLKENSEYGLYALNGGSVVTSSDECTDNKSGAYGYKSDSSVRLSKPKGLIVSDINSTGLVLTWNAVDNADGYNIYRKEDEEGSTYQLVTSVEDTTCKTQSLIPDSKYVFTVAAYYNDGCDGIYADEVKARTKLSISHCTANIIPEMMYTGNEITQVFDVYCDNKLLVNNIDYNVTYADNVGVGNAKVIVNGIGNYCDSASFDFDIKFTVDVSAVPHSSIIVDSANTTIMSAQNKNIMRAQGYEVKSMKDENKFTSEDKNSTTTNDKSPFDTTLINSDYSVRSYRVVNGVRVFGAWI